MLKKAVSKWVWYAVLAGVVTGLFAPTLIANALDSSQPRRCPIPAQGDVLN